MLSFIVPAHDEEASIAATLESIFVAARASFGAQATASFELLVVDDASTDRTAEIAQAAGARVVSADVRQIAAARNAGAQAARGEVFVFVDADTRITDSLVTAVRSAIANGAVGGGAMVRFDRPMPLWGRLLMPAMTRLYSMMRLAAGCFVYATREAFEAAGGFDEELYAGEEIELSRALKRYARAAVRSRGQPARFTVLRAPVETSARKLRTHSAWRLFGELGRLMFLGRRGVRSRERLSLWYGPRVKDPGTAGSRLPAEGVGAPDGDRG